MFKHTSMVVMTLALLGLCCGSASPDGCDGRKDSDQKQQQQQEKILAEGAAQIGMPAIHNYREKKMLKDIYELRDQKGLSTYTYLENMQPAIVKGRTVLGGKLTFFGDTIGYGIPYATQFTSPQKDIYYTTASAAHMALPQADPNGLFSPASAEGTWVLMKDPNSDRVEPIYIEPRIVVSPFKFPFD